MAVTFTRPVQKHTDPKLKALTSVLKGMLNTLKSTITMQNVYSKVWNESLVIYGSEGK